MAKAKTLNDRITQTDMVNAVERWFIRGAIDHTKYRELKDALTYAFQMACSEYLTRKTELICKK